MRGDEGAQGEPIVVLAALFDVFDFHEEIRDVGEVFAEAVEDAFLAAFGVDFDEKGAREGGPWNDAGFDQGIHAAGFDGLAGGGGRNFAFAGDECAPVAVVGGEDEVGGSVGIGEGDAVDVAHGGQPGVGFEGDDACIWVEGEEKAGHLADVGADVDEGGRGRQICAAQGLENVVGGGHAVDGNGNEWAQGHAGGAAQATAGDEMAICADEAVGTKVGEVQLHGEGGYGISGQSQAMSERAMSPGIESSRNACWRETFAGRLIAVN